MLKMWDAHYKGVNAIVWTENDEFVLTGGEDAILNLWQASRFVRIW
jgi:WD40 repeat protein